MSLGMDLFNGIFDDFEDMEGLDFLGKYPEALCAGLLTLVFIFSGINMTNILVWIAIFGVYFGVLYMRRIG
jgi:hypothetical protein